MEARKVTMLKDRAWMCILAWNRVRAGLVLRCYRLGLVGDGFVLIFALQVRSLLKSAVQGKQGMFGDATGGQRNPVHSLHTMVNFWNARDVAFNWSRGIDLILACYLSVL